MAKLMHVWRRLWDALRDQPERPDEGEAAGTYTPNHDIEIRSRAIK